MYLRRKKICNGAWAARNAASDVESVGKEERLGRSKVELLFLGAFWAGEEVESEIGLFGFD
jgi:hypothetical protein